MSYNGVAVPKTWVIRNNYPLSLIKKHNIPLNDLVKVQDFFKQFPKEEYSKLYNIVKNFINKNKNIKRYAIRSSQLYEDGKKHSFSGLFYTELNVGNVADIVDAIITCWIESFNIGVIEYSKKNKDFKAIPCSVIIQQFILSNKSGVIFRVEDKIILDSNFGLAKSIVDGDMGCDEWIISNNNLKIIDYFNNKENINIPITKRVNPNKGDVVNYQNYEDLIVKKFDNTSTVIEVELPSKLKRQKSINKKEIQKLINKCNKVSQILNIENYDIEWTFDEKGDLYILQCRQITTKFIITHNTKKEKENYGLGLVNGETSGIAFKVSDEKTAREFKKGNILVTKRLAGSSLLAANKACGCMIESKSPLSHSAIIARELKIPVIGNINMDDIVNGELYYINGRTGEYKIQRASKNEVQSQKAKIENKVILEDEVKKVLSESIYSFNQDIFEG